MNKPELRKKYKALRQALSEKDIEDLSLKIANHLLKIDIWNHSFYHVFLSITRHKEVNTDYLLNILSGKDKHIIISKSDFKQGSMSHFLLSDNTRLKLNPYGIPEPENGIPVDIASIDVVFVPLLAYDKKGNRIGYGKGFYDRFLSECNPETLKIGLSFFDAEELISCPSDSDVSIDICVSPKGIYRFKAK